MAGSFLLSNEVTKLNSNITFHQSKNKLDGPVYSCIQGGSLVNRRTFIAGAFSPIAENTTGSLFVLDKDLNLDTAFNNEIRSKVNFNGKINKVIPLADTVRPIALVGKYSNIAGTVSGNITNRNITVLTYLGTPHNTSSSYAFISGDEVFDFIPDNTLGGTLGGFIIGNFTNYGGISGLNHIMYTDSIVNSPSLTHPLTTSLIGKFNGLIKCGGINNSKLYLGGEFTNYDGSGLNYFVRLSMYDPQEYNALDTAFCANLSPFNGPVTAVKVLDNGQILVGGKFTNYGGVSGRNYLILLNQDGTVDNNFCSNYIDGDTNDGEFKPISDRPSYNIFSNEFVNNIASPVIINDIIRVVEDNHVTYNVVGEFVYSGFPNTTRYQLATFEINPFDNVLQEGFTLASDGMGAPANFPKINAPLYSISACSKYDTNNSIIERGFIIGGEFKNWDASSSSKQLHYPSYLLRVAGVYGAQDSDFTEKFTGRQLRRNVDSSSSYIKKGYADSNGDMFLVGDFINPYSENFANLKDKILISRNSGALETLYYFNSTGGLGGIPIKGVTRCVIKTADNDILLGGTVYDTDITKRGLIKFSNSGYNSVQYDTGFNALVAGGEKFNSDIYSIAQDPIDHSIYIAGNFTDYGNNPGLNRLIKVNAGGFIDNTFCSNASTSNKFNGVIYSILIQPDQKILIAGTFTNYNSITGLNKLIRLNPDGTIDTTFCNNMVGVFGSSSKQPINLSYYNGKILVGGDFSDLFSFIWPVVNKLVRFNDDGTIDSDFCNNASIDAAFGSSSGSGSNVCTPVFLPNGKIIVGYDKPSYKGITNRDYLVMLNNDGTMDESICSTKIDGKFKSHVSSIIVSDNRICLNTANYYKNGYYLGAPDKLSGFLFFDHNLNLL